MTPSDLQKIADKLPLSEATKRRNLGSGGVASPLATVSGKEPAGDTPALGDRPARPIRFRQRTKPLMNNLESMFLSWLQGWSPHDTFWVQAIRFRLANGLYYTPDIVKLTPSFLTCYEVKGPWATDDAIAKFKMAATAYPQVRWIMAWKDDSGQWQTQEAQP